MRSTHRSQQAFTLLELLVVIAILALLVGLGLRTFGSIQQKSRDAKRKQDLASLSKTLELYYNDRGHYPLADNGRILGCGEEAAETCLWGGVWQDTSTDTLYMSKIPQDPGGGQYYYLTDETGSYYYLFAYLENTEDPEVARDVSLQPGYYNNTYCKLVNYAFVIHSCNYVLMSSNLTATPVVVSE